MDPSTALIAISSTTLGSFVIGYLFGKVDDVAYSEKNALLEMKDERIEILEDIESRQNDLIDAFEEEKEAYVVYVEDLLNVIDRLTEVTVDWESIPQDRLEYDGDLEEEEADIVITNDLEKFEEQNDTDSEENDGES